MFKNKPNTTTILRKGKFPSLANLREKSQEEASVWSGQKGETEVIREQVTGEA